MMKQILIIVLSIGVFSSCDSNSSSSNKVDSQQQTLDIYKLLWEKSNIHKYSFVMKRTCFCPKEENTHVSVTEHKLVEAKYIPSNRPYNKEQLSYLKTINKYFSLIQESIDKNVYKLTVMYNKTYGYPEEIYIDVDKQMVDEEISYSITHFNRFLDNENNACTADYVPVCAKIDMDCITLPCESIKETFSNRCVQNINLNSTYLYDGECK